MKKWNRKHEHKCKTKKNTNKKTITEDKNEKIEERTII